LGRLGGLDDPLDDLKGVGGDLHGTRGQCGLVWRCVDPMEEWARGLVRP